MKIGWFAKVELARKSRGENKYIRARDGEKVEREGQKWRAKTRNANCAEKNIP